MSSLFAIECLCTCPRPLVTSDGHYHYRFSRSIIVSDHKFDVTLKEGYLPVGDWRLAQELFEALDIPTSCLSGNSDSSLDFSSFPV